MLRAEVAGNFDRGAIRTSDARPGEVYEALDRLAAEREDNDRRIAEAIDELTKPDLGRASIQDLRSTIHAALHVLQLPEELEPA